MKSNNAPASVVFVVGQSYAMHSPGDHNAKWVFKVVSRTAKSVKLTGDFNNTKGEAHTLRVTVHNSQETCRPLGNYSMAPILRA